jgi:ABC-type transport system involved in multi-copper enzyme maturation permease subunit
MGKGKPFLEILASAIHEDFRFPFLEIFAFLYALATFALAGLTGSGLFNITGAEEVAYYLVTSLSNMPLFIFVILIFKNIAYGLGNDLEKGIVQTYFSYPLKRRGILTAKLLSALGVSLLLFLGIQISALYILAPDIVIPHLNVVLITYIANLSYPLLIAGIILLMTLLLRRGGLALVMGIVLYFASGIFSVIAAFFAMATESPLALQILSLISPNVVLQGYYGGGNSFWTPVFSEVLLYIGASYVIVASFFVLVYIYFSRRLNL